MKQQDRQLDRNEAGVRHLIIELYREVDRALETAIDCLVGCDIEVARFVVSNDKAINELQRRVEEGCIVTIARQQPMASDLRGLIGDMAIAGELERIGDHAAGIADIVLKMKQRPHQDIVGSIEGLGHQSRNMLKHVMEAFEAGNAGLARQVAEEDRQLDQGEKRIIRMIMNYLSGQPQEIETGTYATWIVHSIERVGDRVTNIAERIVYMQTGESADLNT